MNIDIVEPLQRVLNGPVVFFKRPFGHVIHGFFLHTMDSNIIDQVSNFHVGEILFLTKNL